MGAPIYVIQNAINAAANAGFTGAAVNTIVAIAMSESGLNNNATSKPNSDGSIDRGVLQINSKAHAEVSDSCAYNEACAFQAAYKISSGGTNFNPWTTYTSGAYKSNLSAVQQLTGTPGDVQPGRPVNTTSSGLPDVTNSRPADASSINAGVLAKGAIGFVMMLVGLALLIKALTPPQVIQAAGKIAKGAVLA